MPDPSVSLSVWRPSSIVCAFPATGKTWLAERTEGVIDSDSSAFSWADQERGIRHADWPRNYISHICARVQEGSRVLCSTHEEVRMALAGAAVPFTLVYPDRSLRDEYVERMRQRGSPAGLVNVVQGRWHEWLTSCRAQLHATHIILRRGQYLGDLALWKEDVDA